jgi:uncharacterized phiE125 gp8 family phage protein
MLSLVTPPVGEPLVWEDAQSHLRLESDFERQRVEDVLIPAARMWCEGYTARQLLTATYALSLDGFPSDGVIRVPFPPLQTVTFIKYLDTAGVLQTLASTQYVVEAPAGPFAFPGRITRAVGVVWPSTYEQENAVVVTYVAGYGAATTAPSVVPAPLRQAMLLQIGQAFEHREQQAAGGAMQRNAVTAELLANPFRVLGFD